MPYDTWVTRKLRNKVEIMAYFGGLGGQKGASCGGRSGRIGLAHDSNERRCSGQHYVKIAAQSVHGERHRSVTKLVLKSKGYDYIIHPI